MLSRMIYSGFTSLDGYFTNADARFDWAPLSGDVLAHINARERRIGTYLFGRRVYETMPVWETPEALRELHPAALEYVPIFDKVVYSTTLQTLARARARIERKFAPAIIRELKERPPRDLSVGGATIAPQAIRAGLVDEFHQLVAPIIAGSGTPWPREVKVELELLDERSFNGGLVYLQYRVKSSRLQPGPPSADGACSPRARTNPKPRQSPDIGQRSGLLSLLAVGLPWLTRLLVLVLHSTVSL
jgi:dihydrofolate reductase